MFICGLLLASTLSAQWWTEQPLTILDLHTFAGEIDKYPAPELARLKARLGFNTDTLYIHNLFDGMDDQGFFFRTPLASQPHPDYLAAFLPEAARRGMRTTLYFNVHYFTMEFARLHPDWVQQREGGGTMDNLYGHGTILCVNSPWRDWVIALMRDLGRYPIDGIFVDGPMFMPETCFCHWCREKFQKQYGTPLPSKKQRQGCGAAQLLEFQGNSLADFLHDINRTLKAANPNILLYGNHTALTGNWGTGQVNRRLIQEQDLLASEGGYVYNDLNKTPLWKAGLRARMIETQAGGKPTVIIACPALKPWTHAMLPAAEARLMVADAIANGAGIWLSLTLSEVDPCSSRRNSGTDTFLPPLQKGCLSPDFASHEAPAALQATIAMNGFVKANARYLHRTRSAARVAVVWSYATANSYSPVAQLIDMAAVASNTEAGDLQREFWGVSEALLRAHVPFDVLDDAALEDGQLSKYQAIFLPNTAAMSDRAAGRITSYVRDGGNLFATFETSLYNEFGERRPEFALADVLGVSAAGSIAGPRTYDFMQTAPGTPLQLSPVYYERVRLRGATASIRYLEKRLGPYRELPPLSADPALTRHRFGKGTVLYMSGDLGNTITNFHMPDSTRIVEDAAALLAPGGPRLVGAPETVEFVHRTQAGAARDLFHLVNFSGEMTRPIRRVMPVTGARIVLAAGRRPVRARALMSGRAVEIRPGRRGTVELLLPRVDEYEVVVAEYDRPR